MRNKNPFKWVYFFLRYVVILAHVTHNFLIEALANGSNPPTLCNMWPVYVFAFSQTLATLLELTLASRVFALYNRSRRIAFLLLMLILAETAGTVRILSLRQTNQFHGTCLLIQSSKQSKYQTILGFTVHCMLITLTLVKYFIAVRAGWGRTPLVSLVVRDGSTVYGTIVFLVITVVIGCGLQNERGVAAFFWCTAFMSISGCRMILSMERFARKEIAMESPPGQPLLTSKISLGPLDLARSFGNPQHDSNIVTPLTLRLDGNMPSLLDHAVGLPVREWRENI
ncbi:hypothetical protein OG21DRAFT_553100 [Imleria badia]|nr:hypothetical protein OG21DRAFT_553100 [Imleria badia]